MRVGIITLIEEMNYGNRLQNYAVSELLKNLKINAETICIYDKEDYVNKSGSCLKRKIKAFFPQGLVMYAQRQSQIVTNYKYYKRRKNFIKFNKERLLIKKIHIRRYQDLYYKKSLDKYDYFLCGSDQVWNPYFAGGDMYFLTFAPMHKRISCAASIGVSELPSGQTERYRKNLNEMKYISVREENAAEIVKKLTGRTVDCFFDPVLLLCREEWDKISEPVKADIPAEYILVLFLGELPDKKIIEYAKQKALEVVYMNRSEYTTYYSLSPTQLLYMIKNAECVITDSFHVAAFSIIFQKQFFVFRRDIHKNADMFSRLENLLGKLDLMGRVVNDEECIDDEVISEEHYQNIEKILLSERLRFDAKMKEVLSL